MLVEGFVHLAQEHRRPPPVHPELESSERATLREIFLYKAEQRRRVVGARFVAQSTHLDLYARRRAAQGVLDLLQTFTDELEERPGVEGRPLRCPMRDDLLGREVTCRGTRRGAVSGNRIVRDLPPDPVLEPPLGFVLELTDTLFGDPHVRPDLREGGRLRAVEAVATDDDLAATLG